MTADLAARIAGISGRADTLILNPDSYHRLLASFYAPINWNALFRRWRKERRRNRMRLRKRRGWT